MENNQNQNDNVIDMFFARDEEEVQVNEQQELATPNQTTTIEQPLTTQLEDEQPALLPAEELPTEERLSEAKEEVEEKVEAPIEKEESSLVLNCSGQFSLFGDDEVVIQDSTNEEGKIESCGDDEDTSKAKPKSSGKKSSAKTSSKSATSTPAPTVKPKKDQNLEFDDSWSIHYATQTFRVTDFIDPMPASGKANLEELRVEMEKEFYEMTKDRTKWDYDEALKRLYPDVSGTSKGCGLWR